MNEFFATAAALLPIAKWAGPVIPAALLMTWATMPAKER